METTTLDVAIVDDAKTQQPSACIYLKATGKADFAGLKADRMVSSPCLTFIELDAEIRRLHAELDEVRARAKKKFYKAEAAGA